MLIASIVGARPQFIKASAVSRILRDHESITERLINTGQHYDFEMSGVFFEELDMPVPDFNLGVGSGLHGEQTGRMLEAIERVLLELSPDWVLVYGDTNSTLAGALAAAKLHLPVAHVEAGLRSFNRAMPEEVNRVVTDHLSTVLFAPTDVAMENLEREGIDRTKIDLVGDVMLDVALDAGERAELTSGILEELQLTPGSFVLATIHRAENTDDANRLSHIMDALDQVAAERELVLPLHPRTAKALEALARQPTELLLSNPVGYLDMAMLEKNAAVIVTDSGGVQKEAFFHGVPCVTLRDETEWVELVELGWNTLVSPTESPQVIVDAIFDAVARDPGAAGAPYGEGRAATAIIERLAR